MTFSSSPSIINQTLTNPDTEYEVTLPERITRIAVQARGASDLKVSFDKGNSGSVFFTVKAGTVREWREIAGVPHVFIQSPNALTVAEIVTWK